MATPAQRSLAAGIAALTYWSRIHGPEERRAATDPARQGFRSKLERQAVEEAAARGRDLTPQELAEAVERLRKAHYKRMAAASAAARRRAP